MTNSDIENKNMRGNEYYLYRIKFIKPAQVSLFDSFLTPQQMFERGLAERPSLDGRASNVWHIANVEHITADAGRFAVGRITKTTVEKYDFSSGDFTELIDDSGPYTFVYFDSAIGLLGIARKARVANDVESIARNIQRLLASTSLVKETGFEVRVDKIPDPLGFLQKIYGAYAIKRFKANFTGPNPIDADALFQRPMSYYGQQLGADQGSVSVSGAALNEDAVAAVAKSTAATGNGASALIQEEKGGSTTYISFRGDASRVQVDADTDKERTLRIIQTAYREVRG
ncbi:hypothetical protein [Paraburkholderia strydomiana]|uniref:hypothetical protein n=1 Tax=Paraburkholderia strydomiana TaxID=1245417 RepID=UPI0038BB62E5